MRLAPCKENIRLKILFYKHEYLSKRTESKLLWSPLEVHILRYAHKTSNRPRGHNVINAKSDIDIDMNACHNNDM